jgi:hypothetical protein
MLEKYFGHDIQDAQLIRWAVKARLVIRNLREGIEKNCRNFNMIWEKLTSLQSEVFKIEQDIRNARNHLQWLLGKHYAQYRFGELTAFKHDPLPRTLPFCFEVIRKWKPYEAEEYTRRIGPEEVLPG